MRYLHPAARPDVIHADNLARPQTRSLPTVPHFHARWRPSKRWRLAACSRVDRRRIPRQHSRAVLDEVRRIGALPRTAAVSLATERVRRAIMRIRQWDAIA